MSTEAAELDQHLIGDQLMTVERSHADLLRQGPVELTIDGQKVSVSRVKQGYDPVYKRPYTRLTTIYDAATQLTGIEKPADNPIPILCHREHMNPVAVCRVCVVDINPNGRLVPACQMPVQPGMIVATRKTSPRVERSIKILTELLKTDHSRPIDASQQFGIKGTNELDALAKTLGVTECRFPAPPKSPTDPALAKRRGQDHSSLVIDVDHSACILCDRCVRACGDIRNNFVIGRRGKGYTAQIAFDLDDPMGESSCVACGECMVSCPTGALTNKSVIATPPPPGAVPVSPDRLVEHPLFKDVAWPFLRWNQGAIVERHFQNGQIICREGDSGSTAFVMIAGRFEVRINAPISYVRNEKKSGLFGSLVSLLTRPGKEEPGEGPRRRSISIDAPVALDYNDPVATLTPDQDVIFGEMTCMNHYPRSATVTAKGDCTVWEIRRNVLYMLQRNKVSKEILDRVYRERSLNSQLRSVELFASSLDENDFKQVVQFLQNV